MTRTVALSAALLLTLTACGHGSSQQDGDELLLQEQASAKAAGAKQAQEILAASVNDSSTEQVAQLQADVEALKAGQQGKQVDAMQQQLDDQRAQILALQTEVDSLKSGQALPLTSANDKTGQKAAAAKTSVTTHLPAPPRTASHPDVGKKP